MKRRTSTYPLRLPSSLKAAVAAMKTAEFFAARAGEADFEAARRILRRAGGRPPEPEDRLD